MFNTCIYIRSSEDDIWLSVSIFIYVFSMSWPCRQNLICLFLYAIVLSGFIVWIELLRCNGSCKSVLINRYHFHTVSVEKNPIHVLVWSNFFLFVNAHAMYHCNGILVTDTITMLALKLLFKRVLSDKSGFLKRCPQSTLDNYLYLFKWERCKITRILTSVTVFSCKCLMWKQL